MRRAPSDRHRCRGSAGRDRVRLDRRGARRAGRPAAQGRVARTPTRRRLSRTPGDRATSHPWRRRARAGSRSSSGSSSSRSASCSSSSRSSGSSPWDVLNQGISERTSLSFGTANIVVAVVVLAVAWALGARIGIGTVANAVLIGLFVDWLLSARRGRLPHRARPRRPGRAARRGHRDRRARLGLLHRRGARRRPARLADDRRRTPHRRRGSASSGRSSRSGWPRSASRSAARSASGRSRSRSGSARRSSSRFGLLLRLGLAVPSTPATPVRSRVMKGLVCAGGEATRLGELTRVANKHLLPVGRWPMIYYPLQLLAARRPRERARRDGQGPRGADDRPARRRRSRRARHRTSRCSRST